MLTHKMATVRLEPILYRVVKLTREGQAQHFIKCLHLRKSPQSFAYAAVKALCIYGDIQTTTALEILQDCTGITSLAIWTLPNAEVSPIPELMQEQVNTLPLRRLSLSVASMFSTSPSFTTLDIARVITHLEILDGWVLWTVTIGIEKLTQLTHLLLALNLQLSCPEHLQKILNHCSNLKVLILRSPENQNDVNTWFKVHDIHDVRIVWTDESSWWDWFSPSRNHRNTWDCGEDVVAWRRRMKGVYQDIQHIEC